ncbi:hypothetical protein C0J52_23083 [Blattella germanica]|nr:hypothetical protein C0J52_23083 [Blattella germanica]
MCLGCNDRGKLFYSVLAPQQHMPDWGLWKMLYEGKALTEYTNLYDYSSSYSDQQETAAFDEEFNIELTAVDADQLKHCVSMQREKDEQDSMSTTVPFDICRKNFRTQFFCKPYKFQKTQNKSKRRKARDLHYMKHLQFKYLTNLGVKGNKLQKHFHPQVNF